MEMSIEFIAGKQDNEQSEERLHRLSRACQECTRFTNNQCPGKKGGEQIKLFWGTKIVSRLSGTSFCPGYEFDGRFYILKESSRRIGSIAEIRERQIKRKIKVTEEKIEKQVKEKIEEHFDDVELGDNLSSEAMAELI